jgi:hypothetical protein
MEQRLIDSLIYRLFGFFQFLEPHLPENKYGNKLDTNPFSLGMDNSQAFGIVWKSVIQESSLDIELVQSISYAAENIAQGQTLFYTKKGYIDARPPSILVGDEAVLFHRARCPDVLRRAQYGKMKLTGSWVITMWMVLCMGKHKIRPSLVRSI